MSSLRCSNCGSGIHHHGMPVGIEYIFFPMKIWEELTRIKCPSDRVELDYDNKITYSWRCPVCGAFAFFDREQYHTHVTHVYKLESDEKTFSASAEEMEYGIFFDDYLWDKIAETSIPMSDITEKYSGFYYLAKNERAMFIYEDREM